MINYNLLKKAIDLKINLGILKLDIRIFKRRSQLIGKLMFLPSPSGMSMQLALAVRVSGGEVGNVA